MNNWYNNIKKSKLNPPSWVFGVVWPILYCTMIVSFIKVYLNKKCENLCYPLIIFIFHTILNFIWTTLFFKFKNISLALIDLILLDISLIYIIFLFYQIDKTASLILVPYLIWILFATYLTFFIFFNNINGL